MTLSANHPLLQFLLLRISLLSHLQCLKALSLNHLTLDKGLLETLSSLPELLFFAFPLTKAECGPHDILLYYTFVLLKHLSLPYFL